MADIAAIVPDESGLLVAAGATATSAGGDAVPVVQDGSSYVFVFHNGHTSAITIAMVAQVTNQIQPGIGKASKANQSLVAALSGGRAIFKLDKDDIAGYIDPADGKVKFTYTSHNAALLLTAIKVNP